MSAPSGFTVSLIGSTSFFSGLLASPPPIGNTTPNTGAFTALTATGFTSQTIATQNLTISSPLLGASGGTGVNNTSLIPALASGSTTTRTLAARFADTVNVLDWGVAAANSATINGVALQALLDANPAANILFPPGAYNILGPIFLSDQTQRNFSGTISGFGATITWTNNGNASDTDATMQRGLCAYPRSLSLNSDVTGITRVVLTGLTLVGPAHGTAVYMANSQDVRFDDLKFGASRYNIVNECCINMLYEKVNFSAYTNAGLGLLMLGDTTRVYYGPYGGVPNGNPLLSYWNDSPTIASCGFTGIVVGGIGHLLDHGSQAEDIRLCTGTYFYSGVSGEAIYGIVARNGNWKLDTCWFENVNYPVRLIGGNASEGGSSTTLTGVTAAEPSGTYALSNIPDGYAYYFSAADCFTSKCLIDYNLNGIQAAGGTALLGPNVSANSSVYYVQAVLSSQATIVDMGVSFTSRTGGYQNVTYAKYVLIPSLWTISPPQTVNAATYTVALTDYSLIFTTTACTVSLPNPAFCPGRILKLQNISNITVLAAGGNVTPLGSTTPGGAILAATAGKFAELQSDGTYWRTLSAN